MLASKRSSIGTKIERGWRLREFGERECNYNAEERDCNAESIYLNDVIIDAGHSTNVGA